MFTGEACGPSGKFILWNDIVTLDPRSGVSQASLHQRFLRACAAHYPLCFFLCISRVRANNSNWEGRKPTWLRTVVMFSLNSVGRSATGRAPLTAATSLVQSLPLATKTHRLAACHPAAPCPRRAPAVTQDSPPRKQIKDHALTIVPLVLLLLLEPRVP